MVAAAVDTAPGLALFPRQHRFVQDARPYPALVGGIGSGKTFVGAVKVISRLGRQELGLVCAPSYPMLRDATQRTLLGMLTDLGVPYRHYKSDKVVTIRPSGHEIMLRSADDEDSLRGPNVSYAWLDEAALVSFDTWQVLKGRARVGDDFQAWITSTPKGRNWIWEEWERDAAGSELDPTHPLYRIRTDENPELPEGFTDGLGYTGRFAEQELGGEFVAFEGLVYPEFSRARHVRRLDCDGWGALVVVDVGTRNPTAILTIRFAGDAIHVEREFYRRGMGAADIVRATVHAYRDAGAAYVIIDPSAASIAKDLRDLGVTLRKANNNVTDGIGRVTSALSDDDLTVDPSCVETIAEFESYHYPDGRRQERDTPVKEMDHALDALRYGTLDLRRPTPSRPSVR